MYALLPMCLLLYQPIVKTSPTPHGPDPVDVMFLLLKASSVSAKVETRTAKVSQARWACLVFISSAVS